MVFGTIGIMVAEGLSFADAAYFCIVTIATVGYGDISPATPLGKTLEILLIMTGAGTFLSVVANATDLFLFSLGRRLNPFDPQASAIIH